VVAEQLRDAVDRRCGLNSHGGPSRCFGFPTVRAGGDVDALGAAKATRTTVSLPVRTGLVGPATLLEHDATDGLLLQRGSRRARLTALRVRLGTGSRVVGRIDGGAVRTLFTLKARSLTVNVARRTATRKKVSWRLTAAAAKTLRGRLGVKGLKAGVFASSTLSVRLAVPGGPGSTVPGTGTGTGTMPGTPTSPTTPTAPVVPSPGAPPVDTAPLADAIEWGVRASFRNYVLSGGSILPSDGARQTPAGLFRWKTPTVTYDAGTGALTAAFHGSVSFEKYGVGEAAALRLWVRNPRVVVPAASTSGTLYADVSSKQLSDGRIVDYPNVAFADLGPATSTIPAGVGAGGTLSWSNVPAKLTATGADAFAGFYPAGDALDPVSLIVTRP
ncbi:HtaA domain-containing protein, partial [Patulibacter sp. NPDC049589]|uniref:HtaA domain-containing protein n=1 Tax=Patulibacter sp. NPDC049589 TaxID=3154731 RepID=UPI00341E9A15